jgi:hypothetical protein
MLIALSFASPRRRCVSFCHKHLKGNDILRLVETPTSLRRFYAIRPSRRTTPFGKIRGI